MSQKLLVTGATGQFGKLVLDALLESGKTKPADIIATSRDTAKLAGYAAQGVETRAADFDDPASLERAFTGAGRILIISTDVLDQPGKRLKQHLTAVEAAKKASVNHILYTSMPAPEASVIPFATDHLGTEEAIKATGVPYTILRNAWYMENLLLSLPRALATGRWFSSAGNGRISHISRRDLAAAAASALQSGSTESRTYTLTGAQAYTTDEIAALVTKATGKALDVVHISDEALAGGLKGAGVPDFFIPILVSFDANTREGHFDVVTDNAITMTGRNPTELASFLETNKAALTH
ncbi:SDR family oxidoreductase [Sinorhizobium medicae]|uniref:NmrA family protein n=1 Tax=Sinorhizobium medicae TaxID=110321 RepID=A0A508WUJ2_9HYPH|nr:SDR family oxidoreductase [Sinorhizobium medicae]MDX0424429.1 NAD(P)H-binding protein [Sinorhizobium medicae]MDX0522940.1 NAD(P)H-binding protein [Sinorhizobium medicae]MDX0547628.1 NAD(P)H-binding protein [Sinorhizobium medicae]MDX0635296.1 NAD(P)H-binding protein [Sinorhizobium medicae]MDX0715022.1 NAD(P)H-binding protein [Sinorhizobium medicae]